MPIIPAFIVALGSLGTYAFKRYEGAAGTGREIARALAIVTAAVLVLSTATKIPARVIVAVGIAILLLLPGGQAMAEATADLFGLGSGGGTDRLATGTGPDELGKYQPLSAEERARAMCASRGGVLGGIYTGISNPFVTCADGSTYDLATGAFLPEAY